MPRFTKENAKYFSGLAQIARRLKPVKYSGTGSRPGLWAVQAGNGFPPDSYIADRLERVREQLNRIDARIMEQAGRANPDGQTLNWLCSAQDKLSEQERILAGRPMPGSLRPKQPGPARPAALPEPEPVPAGSSGFEPTIGSVPEQPGTSPDIQGPELPEPEPVPPGI